jgi:hypothetical protein
MSTRSWVVGALSCLGVVGCAREPCARVVVSEQAASALVLSTTDGRRSELTWTRTDGPLGVELDADTVEVLEYDRPLAALELLTTAGTVAWADRASEPFVPAPLPAPLRWVGACCAGPTRHVRRPSWACGSPNPSPCQAAAGPGSTMHPPRGDLGS